MDTNTRINTISETKKENIATFNRIADKFITKFKEAVIKMANHAAEINADYVMICLQPEVDELSLYTATQDSYILSSEKTRGLSWFDVDEDTDFVCKENNLGPYEQIALDKLSIALKELGFVNTETKLPINPNYPCDYAEVYHWFALKI